MFSPSHSYLTVHNQPPGGREASLPLPLLPRERHSEEEVLTTTEITPQPILFANFCLNIGPRSDQSHGGKRVRETMKLK